MRCTTRISLTRQPDGSGCAGLEFPGTREPAIGTSSISPSPAGWRSQTSDVAITDAAHPASVVTVHCLAAFAFNIGVLAFTINVLGSRLGGDLDFGRSVGLAARRDQAAADDQRRARQRVTATQARGTRASRAAAAHRNALYSVTAR